MVDIYAERREYMFARLKKLGFKIYGGNGGCKYACLSAVRNLSLRSCNYM